MKNYFTYLFKDKDAEVLTKRLSSAYQAHMDEPAKTRTRALLQEYMEMRPIRHAQKETAQASPFNILVVISRHGYAVPITALVLVFGLTGGTAFAAEGTLPGDTLYPIKVHVTEEIRSALATTPKAQADWQIERAGRRLEEASTLAVEGNLTDQNRADIEANLADHVAATEKSAKVLASNDDYADADSVGAELHAVLKAHGDILASVLPEVESADGASNADSLVSDVVAHLDSATAISDHSEALATANTADISAAIGEKQTAAQSEISSHQTSIDQSDGTAPELVARAQAQLQAAQASYDAGVAALSTTATATSSALESFTNARNTALDTAASLSAQTHLLNITLKLAAQDTSTDKGASVTKTPVSSDDAKGSPARTAALMRPLATTTSVATSTTQRSQNRKFSSRSAVIHSVIGVLLHGSASSTVQSTSNDHDNSTATSTESVDTSSHDTQIQSSNDTSVHTDIESVHLGL